MRIGGTPHAPCQGISTIPAELHALSDGALEARFDALANRPLKLSKGASDLENELAHRRCRIDGLLV
jgi:hypothetical protein